MTIYNRRQYDAPPLGQDMARQAAPREAFLHHTADAPNAVNLYDTKREQAAKVRAIDAQHRRQGWDMGGYHWVVFQKTGDRNEARAFQLRPALFVPAAQQDHNSRTLAIVVVGNGNENRLFEDTRHVIAQVIRQYKQIQTLGGHRDVVATNCPGDIFYRDITDIARRARVKVYRR